MRREVFAFKREKEYFSLIINVKNKDLKSDEEDGKTKEKKYVEFSCKALYFWTSKKEKVGRWKFDWFLDEWYRRKQIKFPCQ